MNNCITIHEDLHKKADGCVLIVSLAIVITSHLMHYKIVLILYADCMNELS